MATSYTSLLGLALPVTGELSGTWGDTVNNAITSLLDTSIAGTTLLTADADVTLSTTAGTANQARQMIILWTAGGTTTRNITAPAQSKAYVVINATTSTQSIVLRGVGPTTGVTVTAGDKALIVWNGSDFVRVGASAGGSTTQVQYNNLGNLAGSANMTFDSTTGKLTVGNILDSGLTVSQAVFTDASKNLVSVATTGTGNVVLATAPTLTLANATGLPLSTGVSGQLPVANGGTGSNTANGGFNALSPMTTAGDMIYGGLAGAGTRLAVGSNGNVLTVSGGAPVWAAAASTTPGGSTTQVQFNNAGAFGGSANLTWDGTNVQIGAAGALRFADTDSSNYVAFKSPGTVATNVTWTLPATDGTSSQVLSTNGSGTLSWATVSTTPGGSTTQVQFNNSGAFGGSANLTWDGTNVQIGATGALRFADTDSSNYVAFKSPGTVTSNVTWTLPATDGTSSQVLSTNGSGTLSWATVSGGAAGPVAESYQTISSNYSVTAGSNAFSVGPVTVATGVAVTVPTGQVWLIAA
jgi:hypothetical protein